MYWPAADDWRTIIAVFALATSLASLWFARRSWLQSNRPVVSVFVETVAGGNVSIVYNIVVANTGNRPATSIRLSARSVDLKAAQADLKASDQKTTATSMDVVSCFSEEGVIPLLRNGDTTYNSFGYTDGGSSTFWRYGAQLPIRVSYRDLDGRLYKSHQVLRIKDSTGFAGGSWKPPRSESQK
jgi:hypothetical protein